MEAARHWTVRFEDGFELRNPEGDVVKLPYRKVEELFSLLAVRPGQPVSRDTLAAELWPTANRATQQVNLRQTLSRLRSAIGEANVLAGRTKCSLAQEMPVAINRLPSQTNLRRDSNSQASADVAGPMQAFAQLVQWLAFSNPVQALEMMRANIDLGMGMSPVEMMRMLDIVRRGIPTKHPLAGWIDFWAGYAVLVGNKADEASSYLERARMLGVAHKDYVLVSWAVFWEGAARILLGRSSDAAQLVEMGTSILYNKDGGKHQSKVENLKAHVLLHRGQVSEALLLLDHNSESGEPTTLEYALSEALRAFYLAAAGKTDLARTVLEFPVSFQADISHVRLALLCDLTGAIIDATDEPNHGIALLQSFVDVFDQRPAFHLEIYAREALAVAASREGLIGEASAQISESRRIRRKHRIAYTGWDKFRLRDLPPDILEAK